MTAEFQQSQRHLYEQLDAAQTERNICATAQSIPESQLRPLTKLRDNPEKQRAAWKEAVDTATDGRLSVIRSGGNVTSEFKQSQTYLYYQLEATQIEKNISTKVENQKFLFNSSSPCMF